MHVKQLLLQWPAAVFSSCSVLKKKEVKRGASRNDRYEETHMGACTQADTHTNQSPDQMAEGLLG